MTERHSATPAPTTSEADPSAVLNAKQAEAIINDELGREATPPVVEAATNNPNFTEAEQATYDRETSEVVLRWDRRLRREMHNRADAVMQGSEAIAAYMGDRTHQTRDRHNQEIIDEVAERRAKHLQKAQTAISGRRRRKYAKKARADEDQLEIAESFQAAERRRYDAAISHDVPVWKPVTDVDKTYVKIDDRYIPFKKAKQDDPDGYKGVKHGDFYKDATGNIVPVKDENGDVIKRVVEVKHVAGAREKRRGARTESTKEKIDKIISAQLKLSKRGKEIREEFRKQREATLRAELAAQGITFSLEHTVQLRRELREKLNTDPKMVRVAKKLLAQGLSQRDILREVADSLESTAA